MKGPWQAPLVRHLLTQRHVLNLAKVMVVLRGKVDAVAAVGRNHRAYIEERDLHEIRHGTVVGGKGGSPFAAALEHAVKQRVRHEGERRWRDDQNLGRGIGRPDTIRRSVELAHKLGHAIGDLIKCAAEVGFGVIGAQQHDHQIQRQVAGQRRWQIVAAVDTICAKSASRSAAAIFNRVSSCAMIWLLWLARAGLAGALDLVWQAGGWSALIPVSPVGLLAKEWG
jgi:hypothetical protein